MIDPLSIAVIAGAISLGVSWVVNRSETDAPIEARPDDASASSVVDPEPDVVAGELIAEPPPADDAGPPGLLDDKHVQVGVASLGLAAAGTVVAPLSLVSIAGLGWLALPIWRDAYTSLVHERRIRMAVADSAMLPIAVATGLLVPAAAGLVTIVVGRNLLAQTEARARDGLLGLHEVPVTGLHRLDADDGVESVDIDMLAAGDRILVLPGEIVPVDGVVLEGTGRLDQRAMTGESQPVERLPGEMVMAATLLIEGRLVVRVDRAGADTTAGQVASLLERTVEFKSTVQTRGEALGDRAALPLLATAALAIPLVGVSSGLAVLTAPILATVRLAAPTSVLNHLTSATDAGILVRDGRALELLRTVDTFVFDKTGTLTTDEMTVGDVQVAGGWTVERVLQLAASAERGQMHPIANAITAAARAHGVTPLATDDTRLSLGAGLEARVDGRQVQLGSRRFIEAVVGEIPATGSEASTRVFVAVDGAYAGSMALTPCLRPDAAAVVDELKRRGHRVLILSGDGEQPTRHLAHALGVDGFFAETLPAGKAEVVRRLQDEGRSVCFIGDGINDAIALKQANVSVSMNDATRIASDTAQVVLMRDQLWQLVDALDIADALDRDTNKIVGSAAIPSAIVIGGALLGKIGLIGAAGWFCASLAAGLLVARSPSRAVTDPSSAQPTPTRSPS